jgi:hypothetical protein
MSEHPRLDDLVWLTDAAADDANRVLYADSMDRRIHQLAHEFQRLPLPILLVFEPPGSAYCQISAWRMRDHQVPSVTCVEHHILGTMELASILCRKQIARPCVMSTLTECTPNYSAEFAGDKDSHADCSGLALSLVFHVLPLCVLL